MKDSPNSDLKKHLKSMGMRLLRGAFVFLVIYTAIITLVVYRNDAWDAYFYVYVESSYTILVAYFVTAMITEYVAFQKYRKKQEHA